MPITINAINDWERETHPMAVGKEITGLILRARPRVLQDTSGDPSVEDKERPRTNLDGTGSPIHPALPSRALGYWQETQGEPKRRNARALRLRRSQPTVSSRQKQDACTGTSARARAMASRCCATAANSCWPVRSRHS